LPGDKLTAGPCLRRPRSGLMQVNNKVEGGR